MSVDEALKTALDPLEIPWAPNLYTGNSTEYITTNFQTIPEVYAERAPRAARYLVQVHYFRPQGENPNATVQAIGRALWNQGFTWPAVENASDESGLHFVLECEFVNGGGFYG